MTSLSRVEAGETLPRAGFSVPLPRGDEGAAGRVGFYAVIPARQSKPGVWTLWERADGRNRGGDLGQIIIELMVAARQAMNASSWNRARIQLDV